MANNANDTDPRVRFRIDDIPPRSADQPGLTAETEPTPDHGESTYEGSGRLRGRRALITGGDSGIGRAVAIAFAREGADVAVSCLESEREDAEQTLRWIERADQRGAILTGDLTKEEVASGLPEKAAEALGGIDVLVLNAGYQRDRDGLERLPTPEFDRVLKTNLYAPFWIARSALSLLPPGAAIIVTTSIQGYKPSPRLVDYAMTKAALVAFVQALAEDLGPRGIRVNGVAPGPIWTPLIPATDWPDKVERFGEDTPLGRPGQPAELAGAYVYLAEHESSYVSGAVLAVTGGKPL